jgi:hypothetical protein
MAGKALSLSLRHVLPRRKISFENKGKEKYQSNNIALSFQQEVPALFYFAKKSPWEIN